MRLYSIPHSTMFNNTSLILFSISIFLLLFIINIPNVKAQSVLDPFTITTTNNYAYYSHKWDYLPISTTASYTCTNSYSNSRLEVTFTNLPYSSSPSSPQYFQYPSGVTYSSCYDVKYYFHNSEHFYVLVTGRDSSNNYYLHVRHFSFNKNSNSWSSTDVTTGQQTNLLPLRVFIIEPNFNTVFIYTNNATTPTIKAQNNIVTTYNAYIIPIGNKFLRHEVTTGSFSILDSNFNTLGTPFSTSNTNVYYIMQINNDNVYLNSNYGCRVINLNNYTYSSTSCVTLHSSYRFVLTDKIGVATTSSYIYINSTSGGWQFDSPITNIILNNNQKMPYALMRISGNSFTQLNAQQIQITNPSFPTYSTTYKLSFSPNAITNSSFTNSYFDKRFWYQYIGNYSIDVGIDSGVFNFPTQIHFSGSTGGSISNGVFIIMSNDYNSSGANAVLIYKNSHIFIGKNYGGGSSSISYIPFTTCDSNFKKVFVFSNNIIFIQTPDCYIFYNVSSMAYNALATNNSDQIFFTVNHLYIYNSTSNLLRIYQATTSSPYYSLKLTYYFNTPITIQNIVEKSTNDIQLFTDKGIFQFNGSSLSYIKQLALYPYFTQSNITETFYNNKYFYFLHPGDNFYVNHYNWTQRIVDVTSSRLTTTLTQSFTNQSITLMNPIYANLDSSITLAKHNQLDLLPIFNENNYYFVATSSSYTNYTNPAPSFFTSYSKGSLGFISNNNIRFIYDGAINIGVNNNNKYVISSTNIFESQNGSVNTNLFSPFLDSTNKHQNFIAINSSLANAYPVFFYNGNINIVTGITPFRIYDLGNTFMIYKDNYNPYFMSKNSDNLNIALSSSTNKRYIFTYKPNYNFFFTYYYNTTTIEKRDFNNNVVKSFTIPSPITNYAILNNHIFFPNINIVIDTTNDAIYNVSGVTQSFHIINEKKINIGTYFSDATLQQSFKDNIIISATQPYSRQSTKVYAIINANATINNLINNTQTTANNSIIELDKGQFYQINIASLQTYIKPNEDFIITNVSKNVTITPQAGLSGGVTYFNEVRHRDIPIYYPATSTTRGNPFVATLENNLYQYKVNMYMDDRPNTSSPVFPLGCSSLLVDNGFSSINIYCSGITDIKINTGFMVLFTRDTSNPNTIITIQEIRSSDDQQLIPRPVIIRITDLNDVIIYEKHLPDDNDPSTQHFIEDEILWTVTLNQQYANVNKVVYVIGGEVNQQQNQNTEYQYLNRITIRYEWFTQQQNDDITAIINNFTNFYGLNFIFFIVLIFAGLYNRTNQGIITMLIIITLLILNTIGVITLPTALIAIIILIAVAYLIYTKSMSFF